jgi:hypothetical protein
MSEMKVTMRATYVDESGVSYDVDVPIGISGYFTREEDGARVRTLHLDMGELGLSTVSVRLRPREKTYAEIGADAPATVRGFGGCGDPDPATGAGCLERAGHLGQHDWERRSAKAIPQEK